MSQPVMEELSMNVGKEHLLTLRTAAAAFCTSVQDLCQQAAERFLSGALKITDEARERTRDSTIYTVRMEASLLERLRKAADKKDVSASAVFRAWAIELARKHRFEMVYVPIDFKSLLAKDLSEYPDVHAVQLVRGKRFEVQVHVPLPLPFTEGSRYVEGRKVARVDLDKLGKFWVLYIVNA